MAQTQFRIQQLVNDVKARAYLSAAQTGVVTSTWTKVLANLENFDIGGNYNTGTQKFVTDVAGYYFLVGSIWVDDLDDGDKGLVSVYVNGAGVTRGETQVSKATQNAIANCCDIRYIASGIDIELYGWHDEGANQSFLSSNIGTFLGVHLLSI